jgi:hypothetical protein
MIITRQTILGTNQAKCCTFSRTPNANSGKQRTINSTPILKPNRLDLDGNIDSTLLLLDLLLGLGAHDATTPLASALLVLLEVTILDGGDELGKLSLVLRPDLGQGKNSGGLETEISFALQIFKTIGIQPSCGQQCRDGPCP